MNKRYYHWIKLQRRYRNIQRQLVGKPSHSLEVKLDRIGRRLHRLNRSWRLGVSTAALTAWLLVMPGATANAQAFKPTLELSSDLNEATGFKITGANADDRFGSSVSASGDINGDGIHDVVISAPRASSNGNDSGEIYVVFGREGADLFGAELNLADLDGTNGFKILGENEGDRFGTSVSNAGDVNNDGMDDLIIGAPRADNSNGNDSGITYVVFGREETDLFDATLDLADLDGTNGLKILGENDGDRSGLSLSNAGDANGDGMDDFLVSSPDNNSGSGATYLVFGREASDPFGATLNLADLDGTNGVKFFGDNSRGIMGGTVSTVGDINGDGIKDLIMGGSYRGLTYVVFGKEQTDPFDATFDLSSLDGTNGFELIQENTYDYAGSSVSPAGDINGDGVDDLLIAAPGTDTNDDNSGTCYVLFGKEATASFSATLNLADLNGTNGFKIQGENERDRVGVSVSNAGDINDDGRPDVLIGSFGADYTGSTYVVFGKAESDPFPAEMTLSGLDGTDGFRIIGEDSGDRLGGSASAAGDINGDGIDDLITGAFLADDNGNSSGTTYVVFGRGKPVPPEVANALPDEQRAQENEAFSYQVPDNTFIDSNPVGSFILSATLQDGGALPTWLVFDVVTGTFSGTPERTDTGTLTIRITATNEFELTASDEFLLTVNDLPVLASLTDRSVNSEETLTFTSTADDEIGTLTFSIDDASVSKGMTIDGASGAFSWTPTANDVGAHEVTVAVNDGQATDETTFIITVIAPLGLELAKATVVTYPNPTNGILKAEGLKGIHQVVVYSLAGVPILVQEKVADGTLDVSRLEAGSYLITFGKNGKTLLQARIVKID